MLIPYLATALLILATVYSAMVSFHEPPESTDKAAKRSWLFPTGATKRGKSVMGIATLIAAVGLAIWAIVGGSSSNERSLRFLIPEAYAGWVRVEFEVQGAPALAKEGGKYVAQIPASGTLQTSTAEQFGWANDEYYFYSSTGRKPIASSGAQSLIWGKINGESVAGSKKYEEFFVGTEQQFRSQGPPAHP
jgi:uncharacterized protein DUF6843